MPDPGTLFLSIAFGAIGAGFFIYGKRQQKLVPLICGVALIASPWFVPATWALVVVGLALIAVPYFVR